MLSVPFVIFTDSSPLLALNVNSLGIISNFNSVDQARPVPRVIFTKVAGNFSSTLLSLAETDEENEEGERHYMELVEFLRVAVLTIFLEMAEPRDGTPPDDATVH